MDTARRGRIAASSAKSEGGTDLHRAQQQEIICECRGGKPMTRKEDGSSTCWPTSIHRRQPFVLLQFQGYAAESRGVSDRWNL